MKIDTETKNEILILKECQNIFDVEEIVGTNLLLLKDINGLLSLYDKETKRRTATGLENQFQSFKDEEWALLLEMPNDKKRFMQKDSLRWTDEFDVCTDLEQGLCLLKRSEDGHQQILRKDNFCRTDWFKPGKIENLSKDFFVLKKSEGQKCFDSIARKSDLVQTPWFDQALVSFDSIEVNESRIPSQNGNGNGLVAQTKILAKVIFKSRTGSVSYLNYDMSIGPWQFE